MRAGAWLFGGGALAAYWWMRRHRVLERASAPLPGRWVWPVPLWNGRRPVISDGFTSPRPGGIRHGGVDVMYEREPSDAFAAGSPNGTKHFVMPEDMVALAAGDGVIWSATKTPRGYAVVIDHGPTKAATFYTHLSKLFVPEVTRPKTGPRVRAGEPLGVIGADPLDAEHLMHLHFELWLGGPSDRIDPAPRMRDWDLVSDPRSPAPARNGSLVYRRVGAPGEPYPKWLRALRDAAGVYIIRDRESHDVLYVGSSSTQLYGTITRHLQTWRRAKRFWSGQYGQTHDPGTTYNRDDVEVAVRLTSPSAALDEETSLIARLSPRDNILGQRELAEDPPF
jgi:hypothetical protein